MNDEPHGARSPLAKSKVSRNDAQATRLIASCIIFAMTKQGFIRLFLEQLNLAHSETKASNVGLCLFKVESK